MKRVKIVKTDTKITSGDPENTFSSKTMLLDPTTTGSDRLRHETARIASFRSVVHPALKEIPSFELVRLGDLWGVRWGPFPTGIKVRVVRVRVTTRGMGFESKQQQQGQNESCQSTRQHTLRVPGPVP